MIVLKADKELTAVFHKTIEVMEQNVEWDETFAINNNTLILPGKLKSWFFSFDNKKIIGSVFENKITEEPRLMLDNRMLDNTVNMVLYVFGKWGKIKGLAVEKDYKQLGSMMNGILQEIDVQVEISPESCGFYKKNIRITYEDVIELILEYMKPEYLAAKEEDGESGDEISTEAEWEEKYKLGLWHKIIWKSYTMPFSKRTLTPQEKKKSRIGKSFYVTGYLCPECKNLLYMVVYPKEKENKIDTDEGRVILSRAYTCNNCYCFYTPKPYKLLMDSSIYMMDFEEDESAYEDYLELMGRNGERTFNSNYNRYENGSGSDNELPAAERLAELYANMQDMTDEDIFDIADMMDSGFYPENEKNKYESEIENEMRKRGIDRNIPIPQKNENENRYKDSYTAGQTKNEQEQEKPAVKKAVCYADDDNEKEFCSALDTMTEEELKSTCETLKKSRKAADNFKGGSDKETTVSDVKYKADTEDKYSRYEKIAQAKLAKKQQNDILNTALVAKGKSYQELKQAYDKIRDKDCAAE
ncbi:MAG: hypothetical protein J5981_02935, partial [Lachnospira sp.]|nr:hypothetical protein [Lachnospira sp.]